MPSNNSKYTPEFREKTVKYILDRNVSATQMAEEIGIDTNTVCRWMGDYRRENNLSSYSEMKGTVSAVPKISHELTDRVKELERAMQQKEKDLMDVKEKVEILN